MSKPLRKCVVGVFTKQNRESQRPLVLVGERFNIKNAWQFPQGGVLKGEPDHIAIMREMYEELGTDKFKIIKNSSLSTDYFFPKSLKIGISNKYIGQSLHWFSLCFLDNAEPNLEQAQDKEFNQFKWVSPKEAVDLVVEWKKEAYIKGLSSLDFLKDS